MAASEERWFLPNTSVDWRSEKMKVHRSCDFSQLERVCSVVAVAGLQVMRSPLGCNVEIWAMVRPSHLGRIVLMPCCRNFESIIRATSETTLQAGFQDKRNYLCVLAGVEIEKCAAIVHGMSNQRSEKPDLPQHKPGSPWSHSWLPTTSQLHFFSQCKLYLL